MLFPKTTSAREIQRNYRKIFDHVKRTKQPVVVMKNNKPQVAIVDYKKLEEMEAVELVWRSYKEAQEGKAKIFKSLADLK